MMGGFLTRVSILILGYAYPAYACYKTVELNKPEIEKLVFWCQYWILVAVLAVLEKVGDALISWFPLYGELKLAFFVYLWHPKTKGTAYVYNTFFQPYISKHENMIDRNLLELRTRVVDLAARFWHEVLGNGRSWFFEFLQFVVSQPATMVHPAEEPRHPQHASTAASPDSTLQTSTSPQTKMEHSNFIKTQKKEQLKTDANSPISPSSALPKPSHGRHFLRSSTPHDPPPAAPPAPAPAPPAPPPIAISPHSEKSLPHPEDSKQEEPMRVARRPRVKKRVTTTGIFWC
ncbi:putative HVA22-like protein g [Phalaenopsis equestris]|uniref:putative HVA22-like protein g n=1 Tax=Phalaenopsis equestris TaxID=78828 RepID=UPI0009E5A54A|nr:putative HVA22-like protein g [Phalaenopsis equestris]